MAGIAAAGAVLVTVAVADTVSEDEPAPTRSA
jgi:hypothetical protein